jgi:hypothetical protein
LSTSNIPDQKFALDMTLCKDWSGVTKNAQMELTTQDDGRNADAKSTA